jgi:hypothetical protein
MDALASAEDRTTWGSNDVRRHDEVGDPPFKEEEARAETKL